MAVFPVILDANVLYGILPTDLLLTTAGQGLYRAHWTEQILDEARRNVIAKQPRVNPAAIERRFEAMVEAMPEAMLPAPTAELVEAMTNDPGDRHVLAAAVSTKAEIIVTENTKHFPPEACERYGVETRTLDEFVADLISLDRRQVHQAIKAMATRRTRPPTTITEICEQLESYIPTSLATLQDLGVL